MAIKLTDGQKAAIATGSAIGAIVSLAAFSSIRASKASEEKKKAAEDFTRYKENKLNELKIFDKLVDATLENECLDVDLRSVVNRHLLDHYYDIIASDTPDEFNHHLDALRKTLSLLTLSETRSKVSVEAYAMSLKHAYEEKLKRQEASDKAYYDNNLAKTFKDADVDRIKAVANGVAQVIREAKRRPF